MKSILYLYSSVFLYKSSNMLGQYYFKIVNTVNSQTYEYSIDGLVSDFFKEMKQNIIRDFKNEYGEPLFKYETDFELVRSSQRYMVERAEDGPAIDFANLTGIVYRNYKKNESFYIRPITNSSICLEPATSILTECIACTACTEPPPQHECNICYTRQNLQTFYNCGHLFCKPCFQQCISSSITTCAVCRTDQLSS